MTIAPSVQTPPQLGGNKSQRKSHHKRRKAENVTLDIASLPDPYHVKPEDFVHATDLLHVQDEVQPKHHKHKVR